MVTDGVQTTNGKIGPHIPLANASQPLKDKGVEIWAISVGKLANNTDLEVLASDPEKVILVEEFEDLTHISDEVQNAACEGMLNINGVQK